MHDKHQIIEEPCEAKVSRTVLQTSGSREGLAEFNSCTEHFLVATKGKPRSFVHLGLTDIRNVILAPRTDHSRKPEEFFAIADRLGDVLGGSKIELFARELREGWDAWGAEVEENLKGAM